MSLDPTLKTAKILTSSKLTDRFLDTKIYEPAAKEEAILGNTYLLIEVTTPWFPTAKITKIIRNTFLEEYYRESLNRQGIKRFEDGLKAVNKKLSDLAGAGQTEWLGNLNAVIATICGQRLYLSHTGSAEAYLFRQNKISHITEGEDLPKNPAPIQTFSALINGTLEPNDRLVLSNSEMYNFVSIDTLRNAISQISPNGAVEQVADTLFREKADKVNAIFIYFSNETIDAKVSTDLPDTIFLDSPEVVGSIFKKGFRPKNILAKTKKLTTNLGWLEIKLASWIKTKFKHHPKEINELKDELKNEKPKSNLPYVSNSIGLNLSHVRSKKSYSSQGFFALLGSFLAIIINWFKNLNRKWFYGGLAVIIILAAVLGIYMRQRAQTKTNVDLSTIVSSAQAKMNSADTQLALHNEIGARNLLNEAKTQLEGIKNKPKSPVEVVILLEKIQTKLDQVNKITHLDNPLTVSDFSPLVSNLKSAGLIYQNGALYSANQDGSEILGAISDKSDNQILSRLPVDAGQAANIAAFESDRLLVIQSSNTRIFEFNLKTSKLEEKKTAQEAAFPQAQALGTYLSTLYLLDKNGGAMLKYSHSGSGYDKGRSVYSSGAVNLKDVISFAIDGNIYLLHQNGSIEKTLKGSLDNNFKVKNIPEPDSTLDSPQQVITTVDSTSIYVLENKNHRIIELNKNGDYLRQFVFKDNFGEIKAMTVNEKAKKMYLLFNNKIFAIDL